METQEKKRVIIESLEKDMKEVHSSRECQDLKVKYLGKKGLVTELTANMKDLSNEERKEVGQISNEVKNEVTEKITQLENHWKEEELNQKLEKERLDLSLPSKKFKEEVFILFKELLMM